MSLAEKLLEIKGNAAQYVRPESQAISDRTVAWLNDSGARAKALTVGQGIPEFALTSPEGRLTASDSLLGAGLALMVFFRGRWCPYCVAQLEALCDVQPKFAKAGISLLAVSPQTLRQIDFMREQHGLNFPLYRDERNRAAQAFGVAYEVPVEQQELYRKSFVNLPCINGEDSWSLPMPSAFVLARNVVEYASVHANFTERDDPELLLKMLGA
jgi:peroxiredoxin